MSFLILVFVRSVFHAPYITDAMSLQRFIYFFLRYIIIHNLIVDVFTF